MNLREHLTSILTTGLPDWAIVGRTASLDGIRKPTAVLWADKIDPLDTPKRYAIQYTLEVVTPIQDPERADDALDEALGEVLGVLWAEPSVIFGTAQRVVWAEAFQAWEIQLTSGFEIEES